MRPPAREEAEQRQRGHGLAGAGLADEPERLARADREAHAVDRLHEAPARAEVRVEVLHLEDVSLIPA
jgi:hypothetical protein